jgi:dipeptidyl aminopeptidase/acylaminoacyl peptidase
MDGDDHLLFLGRGGWARSETTIWDWHIGKEAPREIYRTSDLLLSCGPLGHDIICAQEGAQQPRRLVRINAVAREVQKIFDPNPDFAGLRLGSVRRLTWRNDRGIECFGDLIFPPDYRAGTRYPLIVVQYETRGFLRGGTGDEFPIQLFAKAGYLVLSVQRPRSPFAGRPDLNSEQRQRLQLEHFTERRSILSAIETEVKALIASGLVDSDRVGITGLSDGSTTVQFAALHSRLFKAASATGCCWEASQAWLLGPALQSDYKRLGWPSFTGDHRRFWSDISLARARTIRMPLLIQAADKEYEAALESYTALRERRYPVDLFVFPDEHHVKRQPTHRAAIYRRNVAWFDFWLKGGVDEKEVDPEELAHWRMLATDRDGKK